MCCFSSLPPAPLLLPDANMHIFSVSLGSTEDQYCWCKRCRYHVQAKCCDPTELSQSAMLQYN